jgi:outer membrane protein assembly factor BamB
MPYTRFYNLTPSQTQAQDVVNPTDPTLYISTLDGTFYALDITSGALKWKLKEDKVVNVPDAFQENQKFFPDPLDGSLYIVNRGNIEVSG